MTELQTASNTLLLVLGLMFTVMGSNIQSRLLGIVMVSLGASNIMALYGPIAVL